MSELFLSLDQVPDHARVWIYGAGSAGSAALAYLMVCRPDVAALGFLDSFSEGEKHGFPVRRFTEALVPKLREDLILIATHANEAVAQRLDDTGLSNYQRVATPSYLPANIFHDEQAELAQYRHLNPRTDEPPGKEHLFFGEYGGAFVGNNKYFFLQLLEQGRQDVFWVCERRDVFDLLQEAGLPVLFKEDDGFWVRIHQGGFFYFDNMTWQRAYPFLKQYPAKKIHLSHGVGLKLTERMMVPESFFEKLSPIQQKNFDQAIMRNDLLVSTSEFYAEQVSAPAYSTPRERITTDGYPKNDLFYRPIPGAEIGADPETLAWIQSQKQRGRRILFYTPTFRDLDARHTADSGLDLGQVNAYLQEKHLAMVVKGHANTSGDSLASHSHIHCHAKQGDVYPALAYADLLITDYSSIYMDVLHLNIPLVFFPYDWNTYKDIHRQLQFDYEQMTPGPKAYNTGELLEIIDQVLVRGSDDYQEARNHILKLAFEHQDGSAGARLAHRIRRLEGGKAWTL